MAAVVACVTLLFGVSIWALARSGRIDAWLSSTIATRLAPWVTFSTARAVWWPHLAVVLEQVRVAAPADGPRGALTADAMTCSVGLAALLSGRVEISRVQIDRLQAVIERSRDGQLYVGGAEALSAPPGDAGGALLPTITLRDAQVEYRSDTTPPAVARVTAIEASIEPDGAGAQVTLNGRIDGGGSLQLRGAIDSLTPASAAYSATIAAEQIDVAALLPVLPPLGGATAEGTLRVDATLSGRPAAVSGEATVELADGGVTWTDWQASAPLRIAAHGGWESGRLSISQGRLQAARVLGRGLSGETIDAAFAYANGVLDIDSAQLQAYGGTWRPTAKITLGEPPHIDGGLEVEGLDVAQLANALRAFGVTETLPNFAAPLQLSIRAAGSPNAAWTGHASANTSGAITYDAVTVGGPIQLATDAQVNGTAVELSNGHVQLAHIDAEELAVEGVDANFSYTRGAVRVAPLHAHAFGGDWTYSGSLPVARDTAWSGQVNATGVSAAALRNGLAEMAAGDRTEGAFDLQARLNGTGTRMVGGSATLRLSTPAFVWNETHVESPANVSGTLRYQAGRLSVTDGRVGAAGLNVSGLSAKKITAGFGYAEPILRLADLRAQAAGGTWEAAGQIKFKPEPQWSGTIEAHKVDFGAVLDVLDPGPGGPSSADGIADVSVHITRGDDDDAAGSATLNLLGGTFLFDDLQVTGPAKAQGSFKVERGAFTLSRTTASAARAMYGPLGGTAATATLRYAADRLTFDALQFTSCSGTWTHNGWFTLDAGGAFAGQLKIEDASPRELSAMLGRESDELTFTGLDLESEFAGKAVDKWGDELRATGSVYLSDGTMRAATVLRPIWEALVGAGRISDMMSRPITHVQEVSETFALRQGRLDTTDLALISDDYTVTAFGSIGLDGTVDLSSRIQLTSTGVQKMLVFGSIPLPTSALPGLPPIPTRITGDLDKLVLRPNMSALPASTARWLADALMHAPRSLGEAVIDNIGRVFGGVRSLFGGNRDQEP